MSMSKHPDDDEMRERVNQAVDELRELGYEAEAASVTAPMGKIDVVEHDDVVCRVIAESGLVIDTSYTQGHMLGSQHRKAIGVSLP